VRDGEAHRAAFARDAAYLKAKATEAGRRFALALRLRPDLSRGFRALKTWFTLRVLGPEAIGASDPEDLSDGRLSGGAGGRRAGAGAAGPGRVNIVCFRFAVASGDLDALKPEIVAGLQDSGVAAPSTTTLGGRLAIRAAIVNHRTREAHIDALVEGVLAWGGTPPRSVCSSPCRLIEWKPA